MAFSSAVNFSGPKHVELIAVVHHDVRVPVVPRNRRHLAHSGRVPDAVGLRLPELAVAEFPDSAVLFENRARVLARRLPAAITHLAGVRGRADIDVERPLAVETMPLSPCCRPPSSPEATTSGVARTA